MSLFLKRFWLPLDKNNGRCNNAWNEPMLIFQTPKSIGRVTFLLYHSGASPLFNSQLGMHLLQLGSLIPVHHRFDMSLFHSPFELVRSVFSSTLRSFAARRMNKEDLI